MFHTIILLIEPCENSVRMTLLLTERDLNRDFFDGVTSLSGSYISGEGNLLSSSPPGCSDSINESWRFVGRVGIPRLRSWFVDRIDRFSLSNSIISLIPGLLVLYRTGQGLFCKWPGQHPAAKSAAVSVDTTQVSVETTQVSVDSMENTSTTTSCGRQINNLPIAAQMDPEYPNSEIIRKSLLPDILAGISVGAMSIPMGMSYAALAGLDYQYGLYNNFIYPIIYFMFGTSRHAVLGVSAMENIMLGQAINKILGARNDNMNARINTALALGVLSSVIFLGFRLCRLAVLADLLADPVLSGFGTASAFLIGSSQMKHVLNLPDIKSTWGFPETWYYILGNMPEWDLTALLTTGISLVFLYLLKSLMKTRICKRVKVPGPLILVTLSCLLCWGYQNIGLKIVGPIPQGLPSVSWPKMKFDDSVDDDLPTLIPLLLQALKLSSLYFIIHISVAKTIAIRHNYLLNMAQELNAYAICNLVGSTLSAFPPATSLSRSSVTESLGVKTHWHGVAAGLIVMVTLLFLTEPLAYLPMPVLASVVLFGVMRMADFGKLARLWKLQLTSWEASGKIGGGQNTPDLLLWITSFLITLFIGATEGIIISVIVSLVWVGKRIVRPEFVQLGRLPGSEIYRNLLRFPDAQVDPGIIIYRIDAPINFSNAAYLESSTKAAIVTHFGSKISTTRQKLTRKRPILEPPFFFILDCSSVNSLDDTAISSIHRLSKFAANYQCTIAFANWKGPQRDYLDRAGNSGQSQISFSSEFYRIVPPQRCFLSNHDAVLWAKASRERSPEARREQNKTPRNTRRYGDIDTPSDTVGIEKSEAELRGLFYLVPNVRKTSKTFGQFSGVCCDRSRRRRT